MCAFQKNGSRPRKARRLFHARAALRVRRKARARPRAARTEADWNTIQGRLAPYAAWVANKPVLAIGALGEARARELSKGRAREAVNLLIAKDAAIEGECSQIEAVEKAIRFRRDLVHLLRLESRAGHGQGKPVSKLVEGSAVELSFMFHELGVGL